MSRPTRQARALLTGPRSKALAGVLAATALVAASSSTPVWAGETNSGVDVVNTETVQVYTDADGHVKSKRLYEQLSLSGHGKVRLENPVSKDGLRNLDGFGGFDVKNGVEYVDATVDGEKALRSLNTYKGDLPLNISIAYTLDGKKVSADDVVGKSGHLQVRFSVENVSSKEQEISFPDGKGGTVTKNVEVPIPIVGSLGLVAPSNFRNVTSGEANLAGDGKGGTQMSFTMTLFPPIGSTKAEFGYEADISDGVVPRVSVSALPVDPLASPTFKSAANSYQGGADTGTELTAGAAEIDGNLLKLRDGAADLLAGLIKLHDGAGELSDGLNADAAPGARKLADGAEALDDGTKRLRDGAGQLADGTGDAAKGSRTLTSGLKQINGGLKQLADNKAGLPAAQDGIKQLQAGIGLILAGLGDEKDAESLIGGLTNLAGGLSDAKIGAATIEGGLGQLKVGLQGAGIAANGALDELVTGLNGIKAGICATHPAKQVCEHAVDQVIDGIENSNPTQGLRAGLASGLSDALAGLGDVDHGTTLIGGAHQLVSGFGDIDHPTTLIGGAVALKSGARDLRSGVVRVQTGLGTLAKGITTAVAGVLQLKTGSGDAYAGSSTLSRGLGQLDDGAGALLDGAGEAADGAGRLADGASDLADGLGDAATGSRQLADGLGDAAEGAPQIVDGTGRLSAEGTSKLVEAGTSTAQSYGEMVAVIKAGGERAQTESMVYGAPKDAIGLAAYSYVIEGADGSGGRNVNRALLAGGLLVIAGGVTLLRRRFL